MLLKDLGWTALVLLRDLFAYFNQLTSILNDSLLTYLGRCFSRGVQQYEQKSQLGRIERFTEHTSRPNDERKETIAESSANTTSIQKVRDTILYRNALTLLAASGDIEFQIVLQLSTAIRTYELLPTYEMTQATG